MLFTCLLLIGMVVAPVQAGGYQKFTRALETGADCPRLYALRTDARADSSVAEQADMTRQLRSVGCFSSTSRRRAERDRPVAVSYTVREYRIYRDLVDAPLYMSETKALQQTARRFKTSPGRAKASAEKVAGILSQNNWFGSRAAEERRASDWARK